MKLNKSETMKILVIEDDAEIIEAVSLAIEMRWPDSVLLSVEHGREGIELAESANPDVVILDLGLPDINGYEVLKRIRLFSSVPIIILTVKIEEADIVKGLELGADDYITKPFRQMELLSRIKALLRRKSDTEDTVESTVACGKLSYDPSTRDLYHNDINIKITPIEATILCMLMENEGRFVSYSALAEQVWGENYTGRDAAENLKVYIRRLRQKLELDASQPKLILNRPGIGYSLSKQA